MRFFCLSLASALFASVACSSAAPVTERTPSSRYERTCNVDDDCMLILQGEVCDCECPSASIARSAEAQYTADRAGLAECKDRCDAACKPRPKAACVEGRCGIRYVQDDDAGL